MASYLWNTQPQPHFDINGLKASGAKAYFYTADTSAPLTVYQDYDRTTPHTFPVVADYNGVFTTPIYMDYVDYRVRVTTARGDVIYDFMHVHNPAPVSQSGLTTVTASQIWKTGMTVFMPIAGTIDGFVRMNARSIGNAGSGATERANADTEALFTLLWNSVDDTRAPVSGGRGTSAASDFIANKTLRVPDMRGNAPIGLDDMGSTAANIIQVSTTCSTTNGSPLITATNPSNIGRGMNAIIDGVETGLVVLDVTGFNVTLSGNYTGSTGTGKLARFSYFPNAQTPAVQAGTQNFKMTTKELAAHTHGVTDPGHSHATQFSALAAVGSSGLVPNSPGSNVSTSTATTGITINSEGGSMPISTIQPGLLGSWFIHL